MDAHRHRRVLQSSSYATQTTKTCQNMPLQCSCLSMHKTVKVCEKLSSRKSFLKEARNSTVAREPKGKQKEFYFSSFWERGRASTTARKGVNYSAEGRQLQRGRASTTARKRVNYSAEGRQLQRGRASTTARKGHSAARKGVNCSAEGRQLQRGRAPTPARKGVNYSAGGHQLQRGRTSTTARKGVNYSVEGRQLSAEGRQLQRGRASTTAWKGVNHSAEGRQLQRGRALTARPFRAAVDAAPFRAVVDALPRRTSRSLTGKTKPHVPFGRYWDESTFLPSGRTSRCL